MGSDQHDVRVKRRDGFACRRRSQKHTQQTARPTQEPTIGRPKNARHRDVRLRVHGPATDGFSPKSSHSPSLIDQLCLVATQALFSGSDD